MSPISRSRRRRRVGLIGGAGALLITVLALVFAQTGGQGDNIGTGHLQSYDATGIYDATIVVDASPTADASA